MDPTKIQSYLSGVDYPCDRDELVRCARSNGADDDTINRLEALPERSFDGPAAVNREVNNSGG